MSTITRPNTKGWSVLETLAAHHPAGVRRAVVAETVGCTVQRVGEVIKQHSDLVVRGKEQGYALPPAKLKALATAFEKAEAAKAKAKKARDKAKADATAAKAERAHAVKPRGAQKRNATAKKLAAALNAPGLGDDV